ncbi:MAG: hypothetical protein J5791_03035 [Fibrobacter sp.]|nr:hypothetical protein [Fibrobacter sp.]
MKAFKNLSVLCALLACCVVLSGCLSHWFVDSSTRLQIENKSSKTITGVDIVSDDGTEYIPWVQDTIRPGEKSRVYEEDWVGTFNIRVRTIERSTMGCACDHLEAKEEIFSTCFCSVYINDAYTVEDLEFSGGSEYVVFSDSENGHGLHYEFK